MEFYEAVKKRRTIREFTSQPINKSILEKILEAGLKAPSNHHLRQWEFIMVRDPVMRKQLVVAYKYQFPVTQCKRINEW